MKQGLIVFVGLLACILCATKVVVKQKADTDLAQICKLPAKLTFKLMASTADASDTTQAAFESETDVITLTKGGNTKIQVQCPIPAITNGQTLASTEMTCETTGTLTELVGYYLAAKTDDSKVSCEVGSAKPIIENKNYIALAATQTSISVDYTKKTDATHPFTILYAKDLPTTGTAPVVKANNAACACTYPATGATGDALKTLSCTFKATDLPADTDATKKKPYPVSVTDACGALEESGLIITINSVKLVLSKFALILTALILL